MNGTVGCRITVCFWCFYPNLCKEDHENNATQESQAKQSKECGESINTVLDHVRNKMLQKSLIENKSTCFLETFLVKCFQILWELPEHKRTSRKKQILWKAGGRRGVRKWSHRLANCFCYLWTIIQLVLDDYDQLLINITVVGMCKWRRWFEEDGWPPFCWVHRCTAVYRLVGWLPCFCA